MRRLNEIDSGKRYSRAVEPHVEYVTLGVGKEMDTDNVAQWFLDDINILLRSIVASIVPYGNNLKRIDSIEFRKSDKGLEVYAKVHPAAVHPKAFGANYYEKTN